MTGMKKNRLPFYVLFIFVSIGALVAVFRENNWYFLLFAMIGGIGMTSVMLTDRYPRLSQTIRLIQLSALGIFLFAGLSLRLNVNFQFPQVIFDAAAGIVSGALVQLLIARAVVPFVFGNAFCSRACWDAVIFELADQGRKRGPVRSGKKRSEFLAWGYLAALVVLAVIVSYWHNPVYDDMARRYWLIGENLWIIVFGLGMTNLLGRRAYCRLLCPFLTLSGLISRFSIFKITPVNPDACNGCSLCNLSCPMMVNVMAAVQERHRIRDRQCILCERCVDACPKGCLRIAPGNPLR
jgi:polyferredoxin